MAPRKFNIRQGMTVGVGMSVFFTISATLQAPPDSRVTAFLLTASSCAFFLGVVFLVARALQARPR